mgnify:CR=1 FL=1
MKPTITINFSKEDTGYSAHANVPGHFIATESETFEGLQQSILEALNLAFEDEDYHYKLPDLKFQYDLESFFDFYKIINAKALASRIGMNQSLLAQYIKGIKQPSDTQTQRILKGIHDIGKELSDARFLM